MATLGRSTPSANTRDLPDPLAEKRELRRMVQELEAENERLREAVEDAQYRFGEIACADAFPQPLRDIKDVAKMAQDRMLDALDGGGESDD